MHNTAHRSSICWELFIELVTVHTTWHGPLARYVKLRVAHAPGMPGTFSAPLRVSDPDMHHRTCVKHVPWCMSGSLSSGFLWSRWRGKRSRHSRRMHNTKFYHATMRSSDENYMPVFPDFYDDVMVRTLRSVTLDVGTHGTWKCLPFCGRHVCREQEWCLSAIRYNIQSPCGYPFNQYRR